MSDAGRNWHTQRAGEHFGPFTWSEVVEYGATGRVHPSDVVWQEGDAASRVARDVPGLLPRAARRQRQILIGLGAVGALLVAVIVVGLVRGGNDAPTTVSPGTPGSAAPVGEPRPVGVAEIVAPAEDALLVDPSGAVVPGDQVLVVLRPGSDRTAADEVAATVGGEVIGQIEFIDMWQIRIPPTDLASLETVIASLVTLDDVELASRNGTSTSQEEIWGERLDPMRDPPYDGSHGDGFRMIGVEAAWQYIRGSGLPRNPVRIGVTDDGLYRGTDPALSEFPPDRPGTVRVEFPDPDAGEIDPANVPPKNINDVASGEGSHGTGVLTVLAGNPDDGGAYGVAGNLGDNLTVSYTNVFTWPYGSGAVVVPPGPPDEQVEPDATTTTAPVEHVQWHNGVTYTTGNFKAIADQVRGGAQVINMSWGCRPPPCNQATALLHRRFFEQMAQRHPDVLFVASAGNDGQALDGSRRWPSGLALPNMITVGNLENDGTTRSSSNRATANYEVTLAAPGNAAVRGFGPDGTPIANGGGTSNAAPQVSGAAALLLSIKPDLTGAQIKELLTATARATITRSDGTDHAIDAGVGGRVVAVDLAVFELIKQERLRLGLDEPNPDGSSPLTMEQLGNNGVIDAVATSTADGWTVRGIVAGCAPECTSVTITTSEGSAFGGSPTQVLSGPGEATWSVSFTRYPGTIVVRRTDNGAGSRIFIQRMFDDLTGSWIGQGTVTAVDSPDVVYNGMNVNRTFEISMEAPASTDSANRTVTIVFDIPEQFDPNVFPDGPPAVAYLATVDGENVSMTDQVNGIGTLMGTLQRASDGTATGLTGTWQWRFDNTGIADATISGTFTLTRCAADGCPPASTTTTSPDAPTNTSTGEAWECDAIAEQYGPTSEEFIECFYGPGALGE